jgi:hypothetical protein
LQRQATRRVAVPLVRPLSDSRRLLRPLLTSRSGSAPLPFQARGEISPGKDAILHRTTVAFTPSALGHESFADACLLALPDDASDALRVPRLTVYAPRFLPTLGHPHAVALHLPRCGQLGRGLAPRRSRPCWAHKQNAHSRVGVAFEVGASRILGCGGALLHLEANLGAYAAMPRCRHRRPSGDAASLLLGQIPRSFRSAHRRPSRLSVPRACADSMRSDGR